MRRFFSVFILFLFCLVFISSCASEGDTANSDKKFIMFELETYGKASGEYYYNILFDTENASGIHVGDMSTYTDVIRIYNPEFGIQSAMWLHKTDSTSSTFTEIADIDSYVTVSDNNIKVIFSLDDDNIFNDYVQRTFTVQCLTSDTTSQIGKYIDCLGTYANSTSYAVTVSKNLGVMDPYSGYPLDIEDDTTPEDEANIKSLSIVLY